MRWGHTLKLEPLTRYAGDAPFLLLDDQIGGKDPDWATERTAKGAPTLLVPSTPYAGLTRADIDQVLDWLADPAVHTASPHAQVREHDCQAAGTLEYVAMSGAAGFGQAWQCTACGRGWARLGEHFHPAEEGAHLPSPEDNALTTRRPG